MWEGDIGKAGVIKIFEQKSLFFLEVDNVLKIFSFKYAVVDCKGRNICLKGVLCDILRQGSQGKCHKMLNFL